MSATHKHVVDLIKASQTTLKLTVVTVRNSNAISAVPQAEVSQTVPIKRGRSMCLFKQSVGLQILMLGTN